jgi:hypothetical protein
MDVLTVVLDCWPASNRALSRFAVRLPYLLVLELELELELKLELERSCGGDAEIAKDKTNV